MKSLLIKIIQSMDKIYLKPHLSIFNDLKGILCLCFHTVFENKKEKENNQTLPWLGLTIEEYRYIFDYFLNHNYEFISFDEIQQKPKINGKYIHVTFDDGYFNNSKIIPILEEYKIPAQIFVVTSNIINSDKFWWDVIYNKRISNGTQLSQIQKEISFLQKKHYKDINTYINENFGKNSYKPISDLDRPFNINELKDLDKNKLITIGNHTSDHAILKNLQIDEACEQVEKAQKELKFILGKSPKSFAFPNNGYTKEYLQIFRPLGIDFAFCGDYRHNSIHNGLIGEKSMRLGRFDILDSRNINYQLNMLRAGISPFIFAKKLQRILSL